MKIKDTPYVGLKGVLIGFFILSGTQHFGRLLVV